MLHRGSGSVTVLILATLTALVAGTPPAHPGEPAAIAAKPLAVKVFKDLVYDDIPFDHDRYRHELDVYMPQGKGPWPVLFFLHGGGWVIGSKDDVLGIFGYGTIARCLAECGLVVVIPNYRLSPGVRHPAHIQDVAKAFAWTCRKVSNYHGDQHEIFVCGHSAGGHLAALLATDERYLKAVHCHVGQIRGVIAISGVYRVDDLDFEISLTGPYDTMHLKADIRPFSVAFGDDPKVAKDASPLTHVHRGLPPFLVMSAAWDYPPLKRMAKEFIASLKQNSCTFETKEIPWRTHETMLFDILHQTIEPQAREAIVRFVHEHTTRRKD